MSTILEALRRLEDDEASQRVEQEADLREHLLKRPPEARRSFPRWLVWLLAIPGAGLIGGLAAALLLPVFLGRDPSPAPPAAELAGDSSPASATEPEGVSPPRPAELVRPSSPPLEASSHAVVAAAETAPERSLAEAPPAVSAPAAPFALSEPPALPRERDPLTADAAVADASVVDLAEPLVDASERWVEDPGADPYSSPEVVASRNDSAPARSIEISDDIAVIERTSVPSVFVTRTIWHPRAERRIAVVERLDVPGEAVSLRMREGDRVGALELVTIEPAGVVFVHNGVELRRRVGARP